MSALLLSGLLLAAWGCGSRALAWGGLRDALHRAFGPAERAVLATLAGAILLGTCALALLAVGAGSRIAAVPLLAALMALGLADAVRAARRFPWRRPAAVDAAGLALLLLAAALLLERSWFPRLGPDSWVYHQTMPRQWAMRGSLFAVPWEAACNYYLLWECWLYWGALLAPDDFILPRILQWSATVGIALLIRGELARHGAAATGWIAACAWMLHGEALELGTQDYLDMSQALCQAAGVLVLARTLDGNAPGRTRMAALGGFFLGASIAMKLTAVAMAGVAVAGFAALELHRVRRFTKELVVPAAAAALVVVPWAIKNAWYTGNPAYPLLADLMPTRIEYLQAARDLYKQYPGILSQPSPSLAAESAHHLAAYLRNAQYIDQNLIAVLLPVAAMMAAARRPWARPEAFLLLSAGALVPLVVFSPARRFVLGASALHVLCIGLAAWRYLPPAMHAMRRQHLRIAAILLLGVPMLVRASHRPRPDVRESFEGAWFLTPQDISAQHLRDRGWPLAEALEEHMHSGDLVLLMANQPWTLLVDRPLVINPAVNGRNALRMMAEEDGNDAATIAARLAEWGITCLMTKEDFEGSPALEEFRDRWLDARFAQGDYVFFRLRSLPRSGGSQANVRRQ